MKAFLMYRDRDFDLKQEPPAGARDLIQDLELEVLFQAMAGDDPFLLEVARKAVLSILADVPAVSYRQDILRDCIGNAAIVRDLYSLAGETIARERKEYWVCTAATRVTCCTDPSTSYPCSSRRCAG